MATAPTKSCSTHHTADRTETSGDALRDEELLARFLQGESADSELAFRDLVVRHGPMVMGVCRHVLHNDQDAEDAFQATFLALARKADTIRNRRILVGWLYEVAFRIAIRARARSVRRRDQERKSAAMSVTTVQPEHENDAAWNELRPVLHEEVNRLPEKYRLPVILSYLEGRSNEEVARLLDWPVGTVKGRLSRARDLLRSRLTRRGLALSAAFLFTALSRGEVFAETVSESLINRTLSSAMRIRRNLTAAETGPEPGAKEQEDWLDTPDPPEVAQPHAKSKFARGGLGLGVMILIAVVSIGFAVASFVLSNPTFLSIIKKSLSPLTQGQWSQSCH
jgi:RNA polymerase sigma factor (sigma-70 family)